MLFSLPLDLLLLLVNFDALDTRALAEICTMALPVLLLIALASLARESLIDLVFSVGESQSKLFQHGSKYSYLIFAVAGLAIFIEISSKLGGISVLSLLLAAVVTIGAIKSIRRSMQAKQEHQQKLKEDRSLWIEEADVKVFWLSVIPILAARLVSVSGGLLVIADNGPLLLFLAYVLSSAFLLLNLQPQPEHFTVFCKRCGSRMSRVLKAEGVCPRCDARIKAYSCSNNNRDVKVLPLKGVLSLHHGPTSTVKG